MVSSRTAAVNTFVMLSVVWEHGDQREQSFLAGPDVMREGATQGAARLNGDIRGLEGGEEISRTLNELNTCFHHTLQRKVL